MFVIVCVHVCDCVSALAIVCVHVCDCVSALAIVCMHVFDCVCVHFCDCVWLGVIGCDWVWLGAAAGGWCRPGCVRERAEGPRLRDERQHQEAGGAQELCVHPSPWSVHTHSPLARFPIPPFFYAAVGTCPQCVARLFPVRQGC